MHIAFGTPRKLPKASQLQGRVAVLDIAFAGSSGGGGFDKVTRPFIDGLGARLGVWVDHHDHEEHENFRGDPRFVLATKAEHGACPEMIDTALVERVGKIDTIVCHTDFDGLASAAKWMRVGKEPYEGCDDDARAIDTRLGTPSALGERIDRALRGELGSGTYLNYRTPAREVFGVYHWVPELQTALLTEIEQRTTAQRRIEEAAAGIERLFIGEFRPDAPDGAKPLLAKEHAKLGDCRQEAGP